ncbi:putative glycoside hydrolase [Patescibacteria group bacterium]|jgi:hypothetical protein|nr:putative glycoside hydrolase [Patescibacteria group bacterium]
MLSFIMEQTKKPWTHARVLVPILLLLCLVAVAGYGLYAQTTKPSAVAQPILPPETTTPVAEATSTPPEPAPQPTRVPLPEEVRGLYWTAETARSSRADALIEYITKTKLNTVVIDLKMDNGQIALPSAELMDTLAAKAIYRIARIPVMRDSTYALEHFEDAIKNTSGAAWRDKTGAIWLDPSKEAVVTFNLALARQAYDLGFDEIQFDYVRFASDGSLSAIAKTEAERTQSKQEIMRVFFEKVGGTLKREGIPVSFDVFGVAFLSDNEVGVGQHLIDLYPHADFISPMTYPSHYWPGHLGYQNPALYPYAVVKDTLDKGAKLLEDAGIASSTVSRPQFRPWLQDFDIGAVYTAARIEAQIKAARDAGASGWMLWNARNVYEPANYVE